MGDFGNEKQTAADLPLYFSKLRAAFDNGKTRSENWRRSQLLQLRRMIVENRDAITKANNADLGNPLEIVNVNEVGGAIQEIDYALANLSSWMAPEKRNVSLTVRPAKGFVVKEPYGVVCIIAPWNYPFRLWIFPLIGAIAAGNTVLVKPSEVSVNTSHITKRLLDKYFDPSYIFCVEGGIEVSKAILSLPFDYFFYTGNAEVGRIVMKAAAEHLAPVTLELGGKSPCIVHKSCKLDIAANRILFAKLLNNGQTCVAPDYILVTKDIRDELIKKFQERLQAWYNGDPSKSKDYSRIINSRHAARLQSYIHEAQAHIVAGGKVDVQNRYVEPTILLDPKLDMAVMKDEIFGPILPIITVESTDAAIKFVNSRPKPLALYVYAEDDTVRDKIVSQTSSGSVGHNCCAFQILGPEIEFGGVGPSGMGAYNGKHTFNTFTHNRAVLKKSTFLDPDLLYPPYTPGKLKVLGNVADGVSIPKKYIVGAVAAAALVGYAVKSRL